jgi:hypothetical protein
VPADPAEARRRRQQTTHCPFAKNLLLEKAKVTQITKTTDGHGTPRKEPEKKKKERKRVALQGGRRRVVHAVAIV